MCRFIAESALRLFHPAPMRAASVSRALVLALSLLASVRADPVATEARAYAAFGEFIGRTAKLEALGLTEDQFAAFVAGLRSAAQRQEPSNLDPETERLLDTIRRKVVEAPPPEDPEMRRYLNAIRAGMAMQETSSGLLFLTVKPGSGPRARPEDTVVVSILAKAPDGQTDLPQLTRRDVRLKVQELLPGLVEGVQLMGLSGTMAFVLRPDLSFGNGKWPDGLQPGMPLIFQVELKEIVPAG